MGNLEFRKLMRPMCCKRECMDDENGWIEGKMWKLYKFDVYLLPLPDTPIITNTNGEDFICSSILGFWMHIFVREPLVCSRRIIHLNWYRHFYIKWKRNPIVDWFFLIYRIMLVLIWDRLDLSVHEFADGSTRWGKIKAENLQLIGSNPWIPY